MRRYRHLWLGFALVLSACGDDGGGLSDYYPDLPKETGEAQAAFAGEVTDASQLVTGPAVSGLVGDFFMKNDRVTFIIQAPTRVIGVVPQGGNVVDAVLTDGTHQIVEDHFGELGMIYDLGRTCEHDKMEIVRDGSGGGVAVIRATGKAASDDFLNLKGIGVLPVDPTVDPDIDDGVLCATTYVLAPGSTTLQVHHSLYNGGKDKVAGPLGTLADTGGNTEGFTNAAGFQRADISQITLLSRPQPIDFVLYQGPGVAYGIIPRHVDKDGKPVAGIEHAQALVAGVSIFLDGNSSLLDILQKDKYFLHMDPGKGVLQSYDLVVGTDGADIDEVFREGQDMQDVSGKVSLSAGGPAVGARVGVFVDGNGNGKLDEIDADADGNGQPDDKILSYMDVKPDGTFSGKVPAGAGNLFLRAEVKNVGRSPAAPVAATMNFTIPSPIKVDFQIVDQDTGMPIPGRLLVIGDHPAFPDQRMFEVADRMTDVVTQQHCIRGTTVDMGDGVDPPLYLPAGGTYRVYASRGTEWSVASVPVTASGSVTLTLKHVVPTPNYLSTDWHVHQIGSPDSNVPSDERIRSAVSAGTEMFAVTDHDYISDLQPLVVQMHLEHYLRVLPGEEVTPFPYGHFNAWPLQPDNDSASHGAIDWARGRDGYAMVPGEIFQAMRDKGARMVQVNHPREDGFTEFQGAWNRANVKYDYTNRTIFGDYENASVPNDYLRLPGESLWSDQFTGLEIWNGFKMVDSNGDGVFENAKLDKTLRDWMAQLSLGLFTTPAGNSDTHTTVSDPVGMPRTYVRVMDDSGTALASGSAIEDVLATQTGANSRPRDVVVTNGPMIDVKVGTVDALGRVFPSVNQPITLTVTMTSADWAEFDTLEVFANSTPDAAPKTDTTLTPLRCWTTIAPAQMMAQDPCKAAAMTPQPMTVTLANVPGQGQYKRYEATVTVTLDPADINTRAGATGKDAWLVFRVRGQRAIFPIILGDALDSTAAKAAVATGDFTAIRTALTGHGVYAEAVTSPVFVDFDGGGYRAPFAPGP